MSNLGDLLRSARLEQGMSLDEIQELTKIRKRYLEAIEDGDYKVLPGNFYVRAFVKTYAETLGLDPEQVLEMHKSDIPGPVAEAVSVEPIIEKRRRSERQRQANASKVITSVLMWLFLALIVVVVYLFYIRWPAADSADKADTKTPITSEQTAPADKKAAEQQTTPPATPDTTAKQPETQEQTPVKTEPTLVPSGKIGKANRIYVQMPVAQKITVEVTATGNSYLNVYQKQYEGTELFKANIYAGETKTFDLGNDGLYIRLDDPASLDIKVNGMTVDDGNRSKDDANRRFLILPQVIESGSTTTETTGTTTDGQATTGTTGTTGQ